ncbi:creatininase family protein [Plastoroseomonas hellenica]|uniref:creatininase family protein n=1 Tax=Plastoroseomonas hellenica TaxID=2687306 RepID=UPI001BA8F440|nr:creatininase family protein [Plastoroseomonas hellenica]MBR0646352.1 creatininase family protein [Plastoroseomonas hellenica]
MRTDRVPYADIRAYLEIHETVIVPIGATECYGPHLATGTELRICEAYATEIGERAGIAVVPVVPFNYSHMFLDYPGTCSVEMATLEAYVLDVCDGLAAQGFRRFFFVNVHNGSLGPLEGVCRTLRRRHGSMGALIDVFSVMRDVGGVAFETKSAPTAHAAEMVTSVALHLCPELVFMDRAKPPLISPPPSPKVKALSGNKIAFGGSHFINFANMADDSPMGLRDDPLPATAAKGERIWENAVAYGAEAVGIYATMTPPTGVPA